MAELKTKENDADVGAFLAAIEDGARRADCEILRGLMEEVTGEAPRMWGPTIVGFSHYHYTYASGREGDWMRIGFSPRKRDLTLYLMDGYEHRGAILGRLGKHKIGTSCLYLKRLSDVDMDVLRELVTDSIAAMDRKYPRG